MSVKTTITHQLTPCQQGTIDRARTVLSSPSGYEAADLAARVGALGWHLAEMLSLVDELTRQQS